MTILKVTYGNPVASIKGICEHYQISDRTARMIVKELEQERGRYGDYTVLGDGALKRVNFLAFTDYWQFRKMLQDKNARKHVPVWGKGLYLWSNTPGSGKTFLSCCLARSLMVKYDLQMRFITAPAYIDTVGESIKRARGEEDRSKV